MIAQVILALMAIFAVLALILIPGEITRNRIDRRLHDLGKRRAGIKLTDWHDDWNVISSERLGNFKLYQFEYANMQRAGFLDHWQTGLFILIQLVCFLLCAVFAFIWIPINFDSAKDSVLSVVYVVLTSVSGLAFIRIWLFLKISENLKKRRKTMPLAVELMTICMESGNGLEQTFEKVGTELMGTNRQIASMILGVRSEMVVYDRKWALEKLEREGTLEEEKELARSLLESLRYGTPLVTALRALAQRMREENMNRLEEVAGKASTKMTIPMIVFLLLPVIIISVAEPIISFFRTSLL